MISSPTLWPQTYGNPHHVPPAQTGVLKEQEVDDKKNKESIYEYISMIFLNIQTD
jgi:hypothetical protein